MHPCYHLHYHQITWGVSSSSKLSRSSESSHHILDVVMITITGIIILLIMEMLATKPAFLQNSKAAKMFKAKVLPTYCSHKVDPVNGPGAQEYRVSQKNTLSECSWCTGSITSSRHPLCLKINFLVVSKSCSW